jgi:hypothetical protein
MAKEIDNRIREVPVEPHWDKYGRANFLRSTYPYPGGERLAQAIEANKGYIRGDDAEVHFRALQPYLKIKSQDRSATSESPESGVAGREIVQTRNIKK